MNTENKPQTFGSHDPRARGAVAQPNPSQPEPARREPNEPNDADSGATGIDGAAQRGYEENSSQPRSSETDINKSGLKGGALNATDQAGQRSDQSATQSNTQYPTRAPSSFGRNSDDSSNVNTMNQDRAGSNPDKQGRTVTPTNSAMSTDPKNKAS